MAFNLFLLWTIVLLGRPQDLFPFLQSLRPSLLLMVLNLIIVATSGKLNVIQRVVRIKPVNRYLWFYFIMVAGIPFAMHRRYAFDFVIMVYLASIVYCIVFMIQVDTFEKLKKVIGAYVLSTILYAIMTYTSGQLTSGRLDFGSMYDPNDLAYIFITIIPLCLYFVFKKVSMVKKIISLAMAMMLVFLVFMTGSRGGFIGLIGVATFIFLSSMVRMRLSQKILILVPVVVLLSFLSESNYMKRFQTLRDLESDYNITSEEGRLGIWNRGLAISLRRPVTGVGVNCFSMAIGYDRQREGILPKWQAPHNSFVQVLVETGYLGFFLYISIIVACLKILKNISKENSCEKYMPGVNLLSGLLFISFVGSLICAFFLSQGYSIIFTFFIAVSAKLSSFANVAKAALVEKKGQ